MREMVVTIRAPLPDGEHGGGYFDDLVDRALADWGPAGFVASYEVKETPYYPFTTGDGQAIINS